MLEPHRAAIIDALRQHLAGEEGARVVSSLLRRHRDWNAAERSAAAEAVWGVGLWRLRLAYQAEVGLSPAPSVDLAARLLFALIHGLGGLGAEIAARCSGLPAPFILRPPPEDWPTRLSYPPALAALLQDELGDEAELFAEAVNAPGPVFVRANTLRIDRETLARRLFSEEGIESEETRYAPCGLRLLGRPNIYGSPIYREGLFEVQDEGSQLLGGLVQAQPGETVLDLCAGAGGKTLLLAAAMQNRGTLYAYDLDRARLERLRLRAERAGVRNLKILLAPPGGAAAPIRADKVLVDAPCSSLGALRRGPDHRFRLNPAEWSKLPAEQGAILDRASEQTAPGGLLVYATCTIRRAENEEVADNFLARHSDFSGVNPSGAELLPPGKDAKRGIGFFRALPHRHGTDGFFAALWRRGGSHPPQS